MNCGVTYSCFGLLKFPPSRNRLFKCRMSYFCNWKMRWHRHLEFVPMWPGLSVQAIRGWQGLLPQTAHCLLDGWTHGLLDWQGWYRWQIVNWPLHADDTCGANHSAAISAVWNPNPLRFVASTKIDVCIHNRQESNCHHLSGFTWMCLQFSLKFFSGLSNLGKLQGQGLVTQTNKLTSINLESKANS